MGNRQNKPRDFVYGHRDRVDEVHDLARSVRGKRYLYIRNFMPHLGYNQPTAWPDLGEIRHEFYRLADPKKMTASPSLSSRSVKALTIALADPTANVRIESAGALARHGHAEESIPTLAAALSSENLAAVQHAARMIELLGEHARAAVAAMRACDRRMKQIRPPETSPLDVDPEKDQAMFILFSTESFLKRFGGPRD